MSTSSTSAASSGSYASEEEDNLMDTIAYYMYPIFRLLLACWVVYFCGSFSKYVDVTTLVHEGPAVCFPA